MRYVSAFLYPEIKTVGDEISLHLFEERYKLLMARLAAIPEESTQRRCFLYLRHRCRPGDIAYLVDVEELTILGDRRALVNGRVTEAVVVLLVNVEPNMHQGHRTGHFAGGVGLVNCLVRPVHLPASVEPLLRLERPPPQMRRVDEAELAPGGEGRGVVSMRRSLHSPFPIVLAGSESGIRMVRNSSHVAPEEFCLQLVWQERGVCLEHVWRAALEQLRSTHLVSHLLRGRQLAHITQQRVPQCSILEVTSVDPPVDVALITSASGAGGRYAYPTENAICVALMHGLPLEMRLYDAFVSAETAEAVLCSAELYNHHEVLLLVSRLDLPSEVLFQIGSWIAPHAARRVL